MRNCLLLSMAFHLLISLTTYAQSFNSSPGVDTLSGPFQPDNGSGPSFVSTYKNNRIFIHVKDWKNKNNLTLPAITDRLITRAWFLGDPEDKEYPWGMFRQAPWGTLIVDPEMKKGRVIVIEMEGDPGELIQPRRVKVNANESKIIRFRGDNSMLEGNLIYSPGPDWIGSWTGHKDAVKWKVNVPKKEKYEVALTYACSERTSGSVIEISNGHGSIRHTLTGATGWIADSMNFGRKVIKEPLEFIEGDNTISMRVLDRKGNDESTMKFYQLELISAAAKIAQAREKQQATKLRAATDWFAASKYGLMVHWLPGTTPQRGDAKSFPDAVRDFNVVAFSDMVKQSGASYLIFSAVHGTQWFPGPNKIYDSIMPGRVCDRDLIGDLANELEERGIKLILYYHHGVGDYEWSRASGFLREDKSRFFQNEYNILAEVGQRYGRKVAGWWFDDRYPDQPFGKLYEATKIGNPSRIVAWNSWILPKSTEYQEYYAGEAGHSVTVPDAAYFGKDGPAEGLLPHFLIIADDPWAHTALDTDIVSPLYKDEELIKYVKAVNSLGGPVTINVGVYQDGTVSPQTLKQVQHLGTTLGVLPKL